LNIKNLSFQWPLLYLLFLWAVFLTPIRFLNGWRERNQWMRKKSCFLSKVSTLINCLWTGYGFSTGGVVMATKDGHIVLENTLDARLEVVFKQQLPEVCTITTSTTDSQNCFLHHHTNLVNNFLKCICIGDFTLIGMY
jgi:hypothetical protein